MILFYRLCVYFLAGNLLSRYRVVPHDAAEPIAPPTIALPKKTAPLTTIGAILVSGLKLISLGEVLM
jgi:hypothetical protein